MIKFVETFVCLFAICCYLLMGFCALRFIKNDIKEQELMFAGCWVLVLVLCILGIADCVLDASLLWIQ